jgi:hypothetical protein
MFKDLYEFGQILLSFFGMSSFETCGYKKAPIGSVLLKCE